MGRSISRMPDMAGASAGSSCWSVCGVWRRFDRTWEFIISAAAMLCLPRFNHLPFCVFFFNAQAAPLSVVVFDSNAALYYSPTGSSLAHSRRLCLEIGEHTSELQSQFHLVC